MNIWGSKLSLVYRTAVFPKKFLLYWHKSNDKRKITSSQKISGTDVIRKHYQYYLISMSTVQFFYILGSIDQSQIHRPPPNPSENYISYSLMIGQIFLFMHFLLFSLAHYDFSFVFSLYSFSFSCSPFNSFPHITSVTIPKGKAFFSTYCNCREKISMLRALEQWEVIPQF